MFVRVLVDKNKEVIVHDGTLINSHENGQVLFVYDKDEKIIGIFREWIGAVVENEKDNSASKEDIGH